jgi:hypothetical protein
MQTAVLVVGTALPTILTRAPWATQYSCEVTNFISRFT